MRVPDAIPATTSVSRALFALWAVFWLLMMLGALEDVRQDPTVRWWEPLVWEGSSCVVATVWLCLQRRIAPRWDADLGHPWRWFGHHLAWLPVIVVTFIPAIYAIRHGVYALTTETYEHLPLSQVFLYESTRVLLFAGLWMGIIFGLASFSSWRQERERLLALQKHLAETQLAQLRAQLQPHFLFNALNTISSLMQVDVDRADRLLTMLADLLRASLQSGAAQVTTLREELELLRLYARIMEERFAGRLTLRWEVDEQALDATLPTMLLQPLLENACKHGVERSSTSVGVTLAAGRENDMLVVSVRNDGELRLPVVEGIGLRNCRERLALSHGDAASLSLRAEHGEVVARIALPYRRAPA